MINLKDLSKQISPPPGPGSYLRRLLRYANLTQETLADAIGTSRFTISQIVTGKRSVTPGMALRLSKATGTSVDIWLNLQRDLEVWEAYQDVKTSLDLIEPIWTPSVDIQLFDPHAAEVELIANSYLANQFPALEEAKCSVTGSSSYVSVFSVDALANTFSKLGIEAVRSVLAAFVENVRGLGRTNEFKIYHFGFEALAIVVQEIGDSPVDYFENLFANVPTSYKHAGHVSKMTITGGVAALKPKDVVYDVAVRAADLMENKQRFRSGVSKHLWSNRLIGRD